MTMKNTSQTLLDGIGNINNQRSVSGTTRNYHCSTRKRQTTQQKNEQQTWIDIFQNTQKANLKKKIGKDTKSKWLADEYKLKSQLHFNNFHLDWQRLSRIIASHWECGENISWDNNFDISHKSEHLHILIQQFHIYVHILRFQLIILRNMQKYVHCSNFHITKKGKHSKCPSIK